MPSEKHTRALPLAEGRMSASATRGRNCVGERPSGRIGGEADREVWREESSAGERGMLVYGAMVLLGRFARLCAGVCGWTAYTMFV